MPKFKKTINITAKDALTALAVEKAIKILLAKSKSDDLIKIADKVNKNHGLIGKALKFI